ncbi:MULTISPECIES: MerR family transcriptional regulator [Klebsiella/Raoultella group]|jgi:predicted site-specific integrase-resolvase|uniref:DNA-binding protein n=1 Tax=Raoultella planticola TaxID=575 RepID=A0A443VGS0_RAOPL|nr:MULTISPECIES: helix-turn-helix domain-containing protein [Raoultella]MDU3060319.1 helix-turn-helix domain-containing protein [Klebsiella oxytoca]MDU4422586.1 helix-turn-helix domain-containing protein [Raoultella sp.]EIY2675992.1 DNA-binding protein [Raoultella planticola]EIY2679405.1 DNA-binding protein [Raoultella planticola]EJR0223621.1 DNA-binding protein [Raoultella planticola]
MLRISDVIELAMVSRKTIYNAINSGRLKYQLVNVDNRQVRMFLEEDVFEAFPKTSRSTTQEQEMQALREEVASLKFALAELQKAVNAMDPESQFEMTSVNDPAKKPGR